MKIIEITYRYDGTDFTSPPADFGVFSDFGDSVLRTERIARLLDGVAV